MDIQEKQAFESNFRTTEIYRRECVIRGRDILEFSKTMNGYFNIITNEAWRLWQAAKAQAVPEGYILIPKKMPDEVNDHLWDFMTDNFVCTNDYGDSFMACDDFNLDKFYAELVKAQEPAND